MSISTMGNRKKGNTFFAMFMRVFRTLDRLIRLIDNPTIKEFIPIACQGIGPCIFDPIRLGNKTPFTLSLFYFELYLNFISHFYLF